MFFDEISPKY